MSHQHRLNVHMLKIIQNGQLLPIPPLMTLQQTTCIIGKEDVWCFVDDTVQLTLDHLETLRIDGQIADVPQNKRDEIGQLFIIPINKPSTPLPMRKERPAREAS